MHVIRGDDLGADVTAGGSAVHMGWLSPALYTQPQAGGEERHDQCCRYSSSSWQVYMCR